MPSTALENLVAEYNSAQLKINHLMKKRPSDFKEQSLYTNLARQRDSAFGKLQLKNYDVKQLELKRDLKTLNNNDEEETENNNNTIKPKPIVKNNDNNNNNNNNNDDD